MDGNVCMSDTGGGGTLPVKLLNSHQIAISVRIIGLNLVGNWWEVVGMGGT